MSAPTQTWCPLHCRSAVPLARPWLPQPYQCRSCLKVIALRRFPNLFWCEDTVEGYKNKKEAILRLKKPKAWSSIKKVYASQRMRGGKGKIRNCHWIWPRGPGIIYNEDSGVIKAFRNIPGITLHNGSKLDILKFAPGGHWAVSAFALKVLSVSWMICMALGIELLPFKASTTSHAQDAQYGPEHIEKPGDPKSPPAPRKIHHRVLKEKPPKSLRILLKLDPYAKAMC